MLRRQPRLILAIAVLAVLGTDSGVEAVTFLANDLPDTLHAVNSPFWVIGSAVATNTVVEGGCEIDISTSSDGIRIAPSGILRLEGTPTARITIAPISGNTPFALIWSNSTNTPQKLYATATDFHGSGASQSPVGVSLLAPDPCGTGFQTDLRLDDCSFTSLVIGLRIDLNRFGLSTPPLVRNCSFADCRDGVFFEYICSQSSPVVTFQGGSFTNCQTGALCTSATSPSFSGFTFRHCSRGVDIFNGSFNNCSFVEDSTAIYAQGSVSCSNSRFLGSVTLDVDCQTPITTVASLDFRNNNWGPIHTAELDSIGYPANASFIQDWWDNNTRAIVDYGSWQDAATGVKSPTFAKTSWGAIKSTFSQ